MKSTPDKGECSCCFEPRHDAGLPPRKLVELPNKTMGLNKRKQSLSVFICENCDTRPEMA